MMKRNTDDYFSLWRSLKPTIAKVRGYAVAGGSDIALSCDLVVMAADAGIGYMPSRVWGCPTTAMWVYRLEAEAEPVQVAGLFCAAPPRLVNDPGFRSTTRAAWGAAKKSRDETLSRDYSARA